MTKKQKKSNSSATPAATKPKDIVITIVIKPLDPKRGRLVRMSGAPEGEMPALASGPFADLHPMLDGVWLSLLKREPQIVGKRDEVAAAVDEEGDSKPDPRVQPEADAESAQTETEPVTEAAPAAELPVIEGDDDQSEEDQLSLLETANG